MFIEVFRVMAESSRESTANSISDSVLDYRKINSMPSEYERIILNLTQKAMINRRYLPYIFKKQTGKNLTEYLHEIKINKVCELLRNTDKSIQVIMQEIEYVDTKNFYKIFNRHTGLTPGEYRRQSNTVSTEK